jgi:hypothetical protein
MFISLNAKTLNSRKTVQNAFMSDQPKKIGRPGNPGWKAITMKISPEAEARLRYAAAIGETRKNLGEVVDALLLEHLPRLSRPKGK